MDILYTVDEKYLQAVEELNYGELPKALHYFQEIVNIDPEYARAYFHLGCCYHYQFKNYQTAGYYYKRCIALEPLFPDVYVHYLKLLVILKMEKAIQLTAAQALEIPGVCKAHVYEQLGLSAEGMQDFVKANACYKKAALATACQTEHSLFNDHLKRVKDKQNSSLNVIYAYQG